jgi:hypothetical protein
MVPDILSIIQPNINWPDFLKGARAALGYDPSKIGLDRPLSDPARFLAIAAKFKDVGANDALVNLRTAGSTLRFLNYGFLVLSDLDTMFELMQYTRLDVATNTTITRDNIAIVSGNLETWRDSIIELSQNNSTNVRILIDKIFIAFGRLGLGELWSDYRKKPLPDTTFLLERQ